MSRELGEIVREHNFSFEKKFGQNFLTDTNLLRAIAAESGAEGVPVVEVGCGAGALTRQLAALSPCVVGFEIDDRLQPVLAESLADCPNAEVRWGDFLRVDLRGLEEELGRDYVVCANLPYYITTPILMKFLEEGQRVRALTLMVQEEVAERLVAAPGTPEYGAVTVAVNLAGGARILRRVSRRLFTPAPNVDSAVVRVDVDPAKRAQFADETVRRLARCAFAMRRKTLANNVVSALGLSRERAAAAIAACGFSLSVRGERLSAEDFVRLAAALRD